MFLRAGVRTYTHTVQKMLRGNEEGREREKMKERERERYEIERKNNVGKQDSSLIY